jgi:hypothetical protein
MSRQPYILVPDTVSHDTVECLKTLLAQAKRGELIGLAYAGMLKRKGYIVNTAGEAYDSPTFSRGMIAALDDQLSQRIRGGHA